MTPQQDYAVTQHDSCCELLGLDPAHNAHVPTLWDAVRELIAQAAKLKSENETLLQKTDTALLDAVKQGIAATPDRTLTDDVLAALRMPMQASAFTKATKIFSKNSRCTRRGNWFLILKPE